MIGTRNRVVSQPVGSVLTAAGAIVMLLLTVLLCAFTTVIVGPVGA